MLQVILTIVSLLGYYLNCKRIRICFILWIMCNIGLMYMDFCANSYDRMVFNIAQIGIGLFGFINWGKRKRTNKKESKYKALLNKVGTLNIVLVCVGLFFVWFNWRMLVMFKEQGAIPETYACAVIAATIGECGICGWIRTSKNKKQEREWSKEDQRDLLNGNEEG